MSGSRLRRFGNLERPRVPGDAPAEDGPAAAPGRFDGVAAPAPAPAPEPRPTARLERFGPEPERSLELDAPEPGARPFTRCARCGMDHTRFATACGVCGASLETPEQEAFNERLWAGHLADSAGETEGERERQAARAEAEAEEARARRALGELLAREVGRRERARLDVSGFGDPAPEDGQDAVPLGLRVLSLLPEGRPRLAAGIVLGALVLGLLVAGLRGARPALGVGLLLVLVLVPPPGFFRRRRW